MHFAEITQPIKAFCGSVKIELEPGNYEVVEYEFDNYGRGYILKHPELGEISVDAHYFEPDYTDELEPIPPQFVIKEVV